MTTTSTFQGMDTNARSSSRVLAPPGGGSSNIFGGYTDDASPSKNNRGARGNNDIFGTGEQVAMGSSPGKRHNPDNVNCGNNDIFHRETHAAAAQPKSRAPRSEFNPITGQPYEQPARKEVPAQPEEEEKKPEEGEEKQGEAAAAAEPAPKPHASTRVSQPPGGRSTKLW